MDVAMLGCKSTVYQCLFLCAGPLFEVQRSKPRQLQLSHSALQSIRHLDLWHQDMVITVGSQTERKVEDGRPIKGQGRLLWAERC